MYFVVLNIRCWGYSNLRRLFNNDWDTKCLSEKKKSNNNKRLKRWVFHNTQTYTHLNPCMKGRRHSLKNISRIYVRLCACVYVCWLCFSIENVHRKIPNAEVSWKFEYHFHPNHPIRHEKKTNTNVEHFKKEALNEE